MLAVMRCEAAPKRLRLVAAKAVAPYLHHRASDAP
jgi:hypothetical protein